LDRTDLVLKETTERRNRDGQGGMMGEREKRCYKVTVHRSLADVKNPFKGQHRGRKTGVHGGSLLERKNDFPL